MGRRNSKKYHKSLHQQAYDRLSGMVAYGQSKHRAKQDGSAQDKIFSHNTYKTYWQHTKSYIQWLKKAHPDVTTLKKARRYVNEYLTSRASIGSDGKGLSAWTLHSETAALCKLFQIRKEDPDRFVPPPRRRRDIQRSRNDVASDRGFSVSKNKELVDFCRATGCRRNVLEKLEGRDLWTREQVQRRYDTLKNKPDWTPRERSQYRALSDALQFFLNDDYFIHHRQDKGGRYRFSPIVGPERDAVITRMQQTGQNDKVWDRVNKNADIHAYRADYAGHIYKQYARPIDRIPYDEINKGSSYKYQSDVYVCRGDMKGVKLDRRAMKITSKALGHNRISVIADNYLREDVIG